MNPAIAQTNSVQSSIQIAWGGGGREFYSYTIGPTQTNRVEILLSAGGKSISRRIVGRTGGMNSLLALAEEASKEVAAKGKSTTDSKPEGRRHLEMTFHTGGDVRKFSVDGDAKELAHFFRSTAALKHILVFASEGQPKAYRLIDEGGPAKAMMLPPNQK